MGPKVQDGVMRLSAAQFSALLEGLDWRRVHEPRRALAPIAPEAPVRFTATIGWLLRYLAACAATLRPERSESPPAANGMMKVIGFDG